MIRPNLTNDPKALNYDPGSLLIEMLIEGIFLSALYPTLFVLGFIQMLLGFGSDFFIMADGESQAISHQRRTGKSKGPSAGYAGSTWTWNPPWTLELWSANANTMRGASSMCRVFGPRCTHRT